MKFPSSAPFVFFLSHRQNYRDVILAPNEIFCGPDTEDERTGGRRRCVKTPANPFDAPKLFLDTGITERPDLILVKADATGRTFPRNLGAFKCPKVLLVGVTHFLPQPIRKVIEYAKSEPFDFIIMDVTRHHAHWFREAGFKNVHWLPALEYNPLVRPVKKNPGHALTFVGQAGSHHPFRKSVLERLKADGFPLEVLQAPQAKAADLYSDSLATLNITLNGDINMRFFEGLAAGGFLLCDRLPEWTGLDRLFTAGEHFDLFGSYGELAEKLRHYFSKPDLVHRIKTAGQARLLEFHSAEVKRREFHELVFSGKENPVYALDDTSRTTVVVSKKPAMEMLPAYEFFQELHRNRSMLVFYCAEGYGERVRRFVDLPRVECRTHAEWGPAEQGEGMDFPEERILHIGSGLDQAAVEAMLLRHQPEFVFSPDAGPGLLAEWGFVRKEEGLFGCGRPVLGIVRRARAAGGELAKTLLPPCVDMCVNDAEALAVADACDAVGLLEERRDALLRAVLLNRNCISALVQLADLALEGGALADGALLLSEANRVEKLPGEVGGVLQELMQKVGEAPDMIEYRRAIAGGDFPPPTALRRILVVTNLFPPQEMGGYGRKIWEFANGLRERGHTVEVLTSNSDYLGKAPDESELALEGVVRRELALMGEWKDGKTRSTTDAAGQRKIGESNARLVAEAARRFAPEVVLLGNLDFLGVELLHHLLGRGIPVIHSLGNQAPWYQPQQSIKNPNYVVAAASDWLGRNLLQQGYTVPKLETVYPGARVDRFYRHFLPDIRRLRIAFAGLVMAYKGPQLLVDALVKLNKLGVDFEAEIAGDTITPDFVDQLQRATATHGISDRVKFTGFLSRENLAALFARSNVLVFPTQVPEAFGISQVEAMAGGLIVVSSGTGGTVEVVKHLENGIIFDPADPMSLTTWLQRIATDVDLRLRLQQAARTDALKFSVTSSVVRIEEIAENLLGKKELSAGAAKTGGHAPRVWKIEDAQTSFAGGRLAEAEDICRELLQADEKCAGAWALLGRMALLNGDVETAGDFVSVACGLEPDNAGFVRELGVVFLSRKDQEQSEKAARRALELEPEAPESLVLLGRVLAEKGEQGNSLGAFEKALRLKKDDAEAIAHYAKALQAFGRGKEAISQVRKACALAQDSVELQSNFAELLEQNKRYVEALAAFGKAARMNPDVGYIWFRQGKLLNGLKRYAEAIPVLEKAVALPSPLGEYFYELGLAFHMSKRFPEALQRYEQALATGFNSAALQCNRGVIFKELRRGGDAIMAFHSAVTMDPSNVSYLNNLGAAALEIGLNSEALGCFEEAARQNPKLPTAPNNIGNLLKDRARGMDALPHYRKSMELDPGNEETQSNYLLCHMYLPEIDAKGVFEEHRKWGLAKAKKTPPAFKFKPRTPGAKWRVGFLSPDFCHHPVAHFIEPLFREYDRERFEFVAYGDQRKSDDFSARFSKQVDLWRETCSLGDQALAKQIHEDRLDILFELSGHTAHNRLNVLAMKPAPLQASYLGYPGTTGLPAIDFRITDALVDPPGMTEKFHTERLVRLPRCAWCYEPDEVSPDVVPAPFSRNGFITFGCFNNMAKLNPALFDMWAEILVRVPGSHLRLKARTLTDEGVKQELKDYFGSKGIAAERLDFFGHTRKIVEHLAHYNEVDIALDSYPYHGTTTTCEALWMGCPVVTREGDAHVSRVGVSLLDAVGLREFVCNSAETYIAKAAELAGDTARLSGLRSGMRGRLQASPLMDAPAFAKDFAAALNEIAAVR